MFGVFMATASIIGVVSAGKYELAIVLPERNSDAANLLGLSCSIVAGVSVAVLLGVSFGRRELAQVLGQPELADIFWWLPLVIFGIGLYKVFTYWATREKQFGRLSISEGTRSVGVAGTQITTGWLGAGAGGLIGGQIAGQFLATFVLGAQVWKEDYRKIKDALSWKRLEDNARKYDKFPKFQAPQDATNSISQNSPAYLLAFFFDPTVVGHYWFTDRLLKAPSRLIGEAVRKVFYQEASERYNRGEGLSRLLGKTTAGLLAIAALPAALVVVAGPPLFEFVFGSEWMQAGRYARWLIVWWVVGFVNVPATMLIPIFGLQHLHFAFEVGLGVARVGALLAGGLLGNDLVAIALYAGVGVVYNGSIIAYMFWFTRSRDQVTKTRLGNETESGGRA